MGPIVHSDRRAGSGSRRDRRLQETNLAEGVTAEELARASGIPVDVVLMLGRPPFGLLRAHRTSGRYRLSQISWARTLAQLHDEQGMTWLEVRAWAAKRQKSEPD